MRTLNQILLMALLSVSIVACRNYKNFPVSDKVPGAELRVALSIDKFENHVIHIKTKYLTDPARLSPAKNVYVVWVKTKDNGVVNVGRLKSTSGDKATLRTLTPYHPHEIFITAEKTPLLRNPKGIEIARIDLIAKGKELTKQSN